MNFDSLLFECMGFYRAVKLTCTRISAEVKRYLPTVKDKPSKQKIRAMSECGRTSIARVIEQAGFCQEECIQSSQPEADLDIS